MQVTPLVLAAIGIPDASQCLAVILPVLAFAVFWWLVNRLDYFLDRLFPHWEWERQLGWLNIRAHRRAETFLRWIRHAVHALLALALYGIVWGVQVVPEMSQWSEPDVMSRLASHLPVLFVSIGFWLLYLGLSLLPKLREEYEADELDKFRVENPLEDASERKPGPRWKTASNPPRDTQPTRPSRRMPGE